MDKDRKYIVGKPRLGKTTKAVELANSIEGCRVVCFSRDKAKVEVLE